MKLQNTSLALPPALIERLDVKRQELGMTRSNLIKMLIERGLRHD